MPDDLPIASRAGQKLVGPVGRLTFGSLLVLRRSRTGLPVSLRSWASASLRGRAGAGKVTGRGCSSLRAAACGSSPPAKAAGRIRAAARKGRAVFTGRSPGCGGAGVIVAAGGGKRNGPELVRAGGGRAP